MAHQFEFPDVGEGVTEGKLISWLVEEGDEVEEDQSLAEVETDKAVVEVPAPEAGTILKLRAEEGEMIKVGNVILTIGEKGEDHDAGLDETGAADQAEEDTKDETGGGTGEDEEESRSTGSDDVQALPAVRKLARDHGIDLSNVEPSGKGGKITKSDVKEYIDSGGKDKEAADTSAEEEKEPSSGRVLATPSTRQYARENDVDLARVEGTGPASRVTKDDVDRFLEEGPEEEKETETPEKEQRKPIEEAPVGRETVRERSMDDYDFEKYGEVEREEISHVRNAITERMVTSKYTAPHVTTTKDVVVSDLWEIRQEKKEVAAEQDVHLTLLPFIAKAVIGALEKYEYMNASFDEEKGEIITKQYYNIGVAVATDHGLMVPVVKNADEKSVLELGREMNELGEKARNKDLSLEEMQGGTFTLTNWGSIGGEYGTPILNFPEVGILGIGRMQEKPVVVDGEVSVEKVLPLSLSFDHRVIDGAYGARFLVEVAKHLEDPDLLLLD